MNRLSVPPTFNFIVFLMMDYNRGLSEAQYNVKNEQSFFDLENLAIQTIDKKSNFE